MIRAELVSTSISGFLGEQVESFANAEEACERSQRTALKF